VLGEEALLADARRAAKEAQHPTRDVAMLCAWALDRHFELPAVEIAPPSFREAYRALTEEGGDEVSD
jgi:hypothetical protein